LFDALFPVDEVDLIVADRLEDQGEFQFHGDLQFVPVVPHQTLDDDLFVSGVADNDVLGLLVLEHVALPLLVGVEQTHPAVVDHLFLGLDEVDLVLELLVDVQQVGREFVVERLDVALGVTHVGVLLVGPGVVEDLGPREGDEVLDLVVQVEVVVQHELECLPLLEGGLLVPVEERVEVAFVGVIPDGPVEVPLAGVDELVLDGFYFVLASPALFVLVLSFFFLDLVLVSAYFEKAFDGVFEIVFVAGADPAGDVVQEFDPLLVEVPPVVDVVETGKMVVVVRLDQFGLLRRWFLLQHHGGDVFFFLVLLHFMPLLVEEVCF